MTLTEYINNDPRLNAEQRAELLGSVASRGKNKGRIKASLPARGKTGRIAWNCVMLTIAPVRAAVWSLMWEIRTDGTRELFDRLESWCKANELALQVYGTRPMQFSLWDYHNDRDIASELVTAYTLDGYKRGANYAGTVEAIRKRNAEETDPDDRQRSLFG